MRIRRLRRKGKHVRWINRGGRDRPIAPDDGASDRKAHRECERDRAPAVATRRLFDLAVELDDGAASSRRRPPAAR